MTIPFVSTCKWIDVADTHFCSLQTLLSSFSFAFSAAGDEGPLDLATLLEYNAPTEPFWDFDLDDLDDEEPMPAQRSIPKGPSVELIGLRQGEKAKEGPETLPGMACSWLARLSFMVQILSSEFDRENRWWSANLAAVLFGVLPVLVGYCILWLAFEEWSWSRLILQVIRSPARVSAQVCFCLRGMLINPTNPVWSTVTDSLVHSRSKLLVLTFWMAVLYISALLFRCVNGIILASPCCPFSRPRSRLIIIPSMHMMTLYYNCNSEHTCSSPDFSLVFLFMVSY